MSTMLLTTQENISSVAEVSLFFDAMFSAIIYLVCLALFGYALYILFASSNTLLLEKPTKPEEKNEVYNIAYLNQIVEERKERKEAEYKKQTDDYERKLKGLIENNKIYAICMLVFFSLGFLILETGDLLTNLINAKFVIFTALIFINIAIAFADNIFEIARKNRKKIIAILSLIISAQCIIVIVLNEERFIIVRLLIGFTIVTLNTINIYALTKKSTS